MAIKMMVLTTPIRGASGVGGSKFQSNVIYLYSFVFLLIQKNAPPDPRGPKEAQLKITDGLRLATNSCGQRSVSVQHTVMCRQTREKIVYVVRRAGYIT